MGSIRGILGWGVALSLAGACGDDPGTVTRAAERSAATPVPTLADPEPDPLGARELSEGVVVDRLRSGHGRRRARVGDRLLVHYEVKLAETGELIESTRTGGIPFSFDLGTGAVIDAWDRGLLGARTGELIRIEAPASSAWGDSAWGQVPANTDLVFELEIFQIDR